MKKFADILAGAVEPVAPFSDWFGKTFDVEHEPDGDTVVWVDLGNGQKVKVEGALTTSGWRFSVNGRSFSARGDWPKLPVEQRQIELASFVKKVV